MVAVTHTSLLPAIAACSGSHSAHKPLVGTPWGLGSLSKLGILGPVELVLLLETKGAWNMLAHSNFWELPRAGYTCLGVVCMLLSVLAQGVAEAQPGGQ